MARLPSLVIVWLLGACATDAPVMRMTLAPAPLDSDPVVVNVPDASESVQDASDPVPDASDPVPDASDPVPDASDPLPDAPTPASCLPPNVLERSGSCLPRLANLKPACSDLEARWRLEQEASAANHAAVRHAITRSGRTPIVAASTGERTISVDHGVNPPFPGQGDTSKPAWSTDVDENGATRLWGPMREGYCAAPEQPEPSFARESTGRIVRVEPVAKPMRRENVTVCSCEPWGGPHCGAPRYVRMQSWWTLPKGATYGGVVKLEVPTLTVVFTHKPPKPCLPPTLPP